MSTHSALGVQMEDGTIIGCYVHYDGATMFGRIHEFLEEHTTTDLVLLITRAQSTGGMRSFHVPEYNSATAGPKTELLDDNEPYVIDETNFHEDHMGTYAWYLVNYKDSTCAVKDQVNGPWLNVGDIHG